jgi:hypothetical protein
MQHWLQTAEVATASRQIWACMRRLRQPASQATDWLIVVLQTWRDELVGGLRLRIGSRYSKTSTPRKEVQRTGAPPTGEFALRQRFALLWTQQPCSGQGPNSSGHPRVTPGGLVSPAPGHVRSGPLLSHRDGASCAKRRTRSSRLLGAGRVPMPVSPSPRGNYASLG